ncbi:hypothetical protein QLX67_08805 [Balneolaceae bacterium ANBcel3]|nr:hypothetical protein [Balneolaceae bacterium ANBcel3]
MKKYSFTHVFVALLLVGACSVTDKKNKELHKLDLTNAGTLFIASNDMQKHNSDADRMSVSGQSERTTLFKITDEGYIEEVSYLDEDGNEVSYTLYPTGVFNVNEEYLIIIFGYGTTGYLVRKSDGAAFTLMDVGFPMKGSGGHLNWPRVHTDDRNNAYYRSADYLGDDAWNHFVLRINLNNPAQLTAQAISPAQEDVGFFLVNRNGDVLYDGISTSPRVIFAEGGLVNTPVNTSDFWLGSDREFYGLTYIQHGVNQIRRLEVRNRELIPEDYGQALDIWFMTDAVFVLNLLEKVYIVNTAGPVGEVFEVNNPQNIPKRVQGLNMATIQHAVASDRYYYLSGTDEANRPTLLKVDAQTNTPVPLLPPGQYDIYNMAVSNEDLLSFSALRMQDGKRVVGQVNAGGSLEILDEDMDADVIVLERIN